MQCFDLLAHLFPIPSIHFHYHPLTHSSWLESTRSRSIKFRFASVLTPLTTTVGSPKIAGSSLTGSGTSRTTGTGSKDSPSKLAKTLRPLASLGSLRGRKAEDARKPSVAAASVDTDPSRLPTVPSRASSHPGVAPSNRPRRSSPASSPTNTARRLSVGRPQPDSRLLQPSDFTSAPRRAPVAPNDSGRDSASDEPIDRSIDSGSRGESESDSADILSLDTSGSESTNSSLLSQDDTAYRPSSLFSDRRLSAWDSKVYALASAQASKNEHQDLPTVPGGDKHFSVRPLSGWDARLFGGSLTVAKEEEEEEEDRGATLDTAQARAQAQAQAEARFSVRRMSGWDAELFNAISSSNAAGAAASNKDGPSRPLPHSRSRSTTVFSDRRKSAWDGLFCSNTGEDDTNQSGDDNNNNNIPNDDSLNDVDISSRAIFSMRSPAEWDAALRERGIKIALDDVATPTQEAHDRLASAEVASTKT